MPKQRHRLRRRRQATVLQHDADPRPMLGGGAPRRRCPRTAPRPESGRCRPSRHSIVVVLPAPLGPRTAVTVPDSARPRHAVDGPDVAETSVVAHGRRPRARLDILGCLLTPAASTDHDGSVHDEDRPRRLARRGRRRGAGPPRLAGAGGPRVAAWLGVLPLAVAAFFRDPDRRPGHRPSSIPTSSSPPPTARSCMPVRRSRGVAPEGEWLQVSIFLSVLDVHINRAPYGGRVTDVTYRPGRWLAAYRAESATENERSEITVDREVDGADPHRRLPPDRRGAGAPGRHPRRARSELRTGQRIGLMKFGSRMDVFVPSDDHPRGRGGRPHDGGRDDARPLAGTPS